MANGSKAAGPLGKINQVRSVVSIIKEMSLDEIRDDAERMPKILLLSDDPAGSSLVEELTGTPPNASATLERLDRIPSNLERYDVILVHAPGPKTPFKEIRERAGLRSDRVFDLTGTDGPDWAERTRQQIVDHATDDLAALGRWFPAFREQAAGRVIADTARANAQFALVANLPSVVPILGSLASVGADLIVLTKNQLTMAIKLAAIHGRPLDDRTQLLKEIAPVAGVGLGWRTLAREATSFIPLAGGTIPKVLIAYSGTFATGRALDFYFRFGEKPAKTQLRDFYDQAQATARRIIPGLKDDVVDTDSSRSSPPPSSPSPRAPRDIPAPPTGPTPASDPPRDATSSTG